jgi:hypothetical protein
MGVTLLMSLSSLDLPFLQSSSQDLISRGYDASPLPSLRGRPFATLGHLLVSLALQLTLFIVSLALQ